MPNNLWNRRNAWALRHLKLTFAQAMRLVAVLIASSGICLLAFFRLSAENERALRAEIASAAEARLALLRSSTERSLDALRAIRAYLEVTPTPTRADFRAFVSEPLRRLPEVQAFEWIPRVTSAERARYERQAWNDGYTSFGFAELGPDGALRPARAADEYFPVYYAEPLELNLPALGLDLGSHPLRKQALESARRSGEPVATPPIRLAQETREGQLGLLVYMPVFAAGVREREELRGFALAVLRIHDFVQPAFESLRRDEIGVEIRNPSQKGKLLFTTFERAEAVAAERGPADGSTDPERARFGYRGMLELPAQRWEVSFVPSSAFLRARSRSSTYAYPLAAWLLVLLGTAYAVRGMRHTVEIEQRVEERTQELTREIETRRHVEAALRATETKYRSIFENAALGIFQTTLEGSYLDANPALAAIYGYESRAELISATNDIGRQIYVDPGRRAEFVALMRASARVSEFVSEVFRKDGSKIWISETAVAVRERGGNILYYEGTVQDITERVQASEVQKRAYEWLEERVHARTVELADANSRLEGEIAVRKRAQEEAAAAREAQAQFLASMSHEIRTPLNAILGYSQILQRHGDDEALQREALQTIVQSGHHLLTLVDEVIDLSKIESRHVELRVGDFNLGQLISGLAFIMRSKCEKKSLRLRVEGLGDAPRWVRGDEGKLRQVLINLLGNAVKFTETGEVRLRVVPEEVDAFRFEVIDTGIGIPADQRDRIFGHFYQGDASRAGEGAGLGLAISRRLVELMGGTLEVRSAPGWGSNFYFTLPLSAPIAIDPSQTTSARPQIRLSHGTPCRVLVVDDLQVNRDILRHMLVTIGCEVSTAASGPAALEELDRLAHEVVFLDVLMPGMDGIEVARILKERNAENGPKLVAFSASALEEQRTAYLAAGFDDFIPKPFRMERINDCLVSLLQVRFVGVGAAESLEPRRIPSFDIERLQVPAGVLSQIREAAETYQTTRLRAALGRLESCGAGEQALAEYLRGCAAIYDMPSVLETVKRLGEARA
ncbi:MAG TPA: CHASE domain-containing protein [Polyangiaceae bacterium]